MSVPVSKRTLSQYEFYNTAVRLRTKVAEWLLRDLGAKPKVRDLSFIGKRYLMSDEDKKALDDLFDKYGLCHVSRVVDRRTAALFGRYLF